MKFFGKILALCAAFVLTAACTGNLGSVSDTAPVTESEITESETVTSETAAPAAPVPDRKKIGVSMPTKNLQRWNQDGDYIKKALEAAGYEVCLEYGGDNEARVQISQIEGMVNSGCELLIIAAVEGSSLTGVLASAKEKNIPVISYDRLIMNTDAVCCYATFDNRKVGVLQGEYIEKKLNLKAGGGPYNIEFFTGDPNDNNINFFYGGAMEVLKPYLDSGVLVCPSGQVNIADAATPGWKPENARKRMEALINANGYAPDKTRLDAVMCSNDSTANGVTDALINAGFYKGDFPVVTGQDCDIISVGNMINGTQSMSVFKDTRILAARTVDMARAILQGGEPPINDRETYDNGTGVIPAYLCAPVVCDINNYKAVLIDAGYYTAEQLG